MLFGRGELLPPLPRATTATVLPASGVTGADVDAVKFTQTLRGYKTSEVDWVLDRLGQELDLLRGQLAAVRAAHGLDEDARRATASRAAPTRCRRRTGDDERDRQCDRPTTAAIRCGWIDQSRLAPADFVLYRDYHDTEWGQPLRGSEALFERSQPGGVPERAVVADHPAQAGELPARVPRVRRRRRSRATPTATSSG